MHLCAVRDAKPLKALCTVLPVLCCTLAGEVNSKIRTKGS